MEIKGHYTDGKISEFNGFHFQWNVDITHIQQNFPFALQSWVNPHAGFEVLPLTLQSEIGGHRIISLIKGNLKN
ncbi:MAG TPA: hypothetical protein VGB37_14765 [Candidatus Lokiarchaeia archaeon]